MNKNIKKMTSWLLASLIVFAPIGQPIYGETIESIKAPEIQSPSIWAIEEIYEAEVFGWLPDDYSTTIRTTVSDEQLEKIISGVRYKLDSLGFERDESVKTLKVDGISTRGTVLTKMFNELIKYKMPSTLIDRSKTQFDFMQSMGVLNGNGVDLMLDKECTLQEALVFGSRFINSVYEKLYKSSDGMLWEVQSGNNKVYLLGTVHISRQDTYPFSKNLKNAFNESDKIVFEVDFLDKEGSDYIIQKQIYEDGDTLKSNVSKELYKRIVAAAEQVGLSEASINQYKPWALANLLTVMSLNYADEDLSSIPGVDVYFYNLCYLKAKEILEIEGYKYQADLFDGLSKETQIANLEEATKLLEDTLNSTDGKTESSQYLDSWLESWKNRDLIAFNEQYNKDELDEDATDAEKEYMSALFDNRDIHMTETIIEYLNAPGENTYFVAVGAGHMVGKTGIVQRLKDNGYDVKITEK